MILTAEKYNKLVDISIEKIYNRYVSYYIPIF